MRVVQVILVLALLLAAPSAHAGPDIEIVSFSAPAIASRGAYIGSQFTLTVRNRGDVDVTVDFAVGFYISTDAEISRFEDTLLIGGREFVHGLAAGATKNVPLFWGAKIPANYPCATIEDPFLGVIVDEYNVIPEDDETDNTAASPVMLRDCPVSTSQTSWGLVKARY